jgi:hypothetical protein
MHAWFCEERPESNETRLQTFYRRWRQWKEHRLAEEVERIEDLVGMGEVPSYLRRQAD